MALVGVRTDSQNERMRREHIGPAPGSPTPAQPSAQVALGRRSGSAGLAFVVLLLLSAGMASVPGGQDAASVVEEFYTGATAVIVLAQLVGLLAAASFALFTWTLTAHRRAAWAGPVRRAG